MQLSRQSLERLGISEIFPQNLWKGLEFLLQFHFLNDGLASLTIPICSPIQVLPKTPEDVDILTSTESFDGSFVFWFGNASEIREKMGELAQEKLTRETVDEGGVKALLSDSVEKVNSEVDHNLGGEIESSSIATIAIVDNNPQLLVNEKQSVVLDNDSETPLINDSRKIDRHLELDSVEDGEHGILSEDTTDKCNRVTSASKKESQVDDDKVVVVSTVIPESNSDILSDQNGDAVGEVDDGHNGRNG
ncbi:hypothetical protein SESBI_30443 [Sesbania bispinosa]|nr:hypothetical protein SESBI_30443 [Sesbania bispinosa]